MSSAKQESGRSRAGAAPLNGAVPVRRLHLTPAWAGRDLSLEEFENADTRDDYEYELIDGRVEVFSTPEPPHDFIVEWVRERLRAYRDTHPEVINYLTGGARVFIPSRRAATCPRPDLSAFRDYPLRWRQMAGWQDLHPILVVEVISPKYANKDLVRNVALYREAPHVREYWIFDPRDRDGRLTLRVYRKRGSRSWQSPLDVPFAGTYTTPLLPGFSLVVDPNA